MLLAPAPLFRDPIFDGAADPTLIWNYQEHNWWLLYTNRRANVACQGVAWVHGTDIGIASSSDEGHTWQYRGTLQGLEFEPGRNTFWAPEVFCHEGIYHMYVSYIPGVPQDWSGSRTILHMTSQRSMGLELREHLVADLEQRDRCLCFPPARWSLAHVVQG